MSQKPQTTQKSQVRQRRYTDDELVLINNTFAGQNELLLILRKHFLQGKLSKTEKDSMRLFASDKLFTVIKKTFYPEIDFSTPLGQLVDLWTNINTREKDVEGAWLEMAAREIVVRYISERINALIGETDGGLSFESLNFDSSKPKEQNFINLSARNTIISHTELMLGQLWVLSGDQKESIEQIQQRLAQNSNK